jgi:DNA-binding beta-propeller fold protein YncE
MVLNLLWCALFAALLNARAPLFSQQDTGIPTTLVFPPYLHSYGIQRATQAKLFMLLPFKTKFANPQGLAVTKMTARDDTTTEHDDDEVTVYGVNSGRGEIIYNTSMYGLALWGRRGSGREEMKNPKGVACDEQGNVYICDTGNNRIVRLFNPKKKVVFVKHLGRPFLKTPTHITLGGKGNLYVSDTDNHRILILDKEGRIRREIKEIDKRPLSCPLGLAVNLKNEQWHYFHRNYLFFLNDSGKTLVRLDLDNGRVSAVDPGKLIEQHCTHDFMAADFYGNLYLTDIKRGTIDKFDIHLNYLVSFGAAGTGDREFVEPRGICIWKRYGQTFIAEKAGAQYYWVGTDFSRIRMIRRGDRGRQRLFTLDGHIYETSFVSLYLLSSLGDTLKTVFKKKKRFPLELNVFFSNTDAYGPGNRWLAVFEPTYSSYTYFRKSLVLPYE